MSQPVYLVTGEPWLASEALARIRTEAGTDSLSEVSFDAGVDPSELTIALGTASLLGGRRLVIVHDASGLKKEQIEALSAYLDKPSPDAILVLVAPGRSKLDALVKKSGTVVALEAPRGRKLVAWLKERAVARRLRLDDRAAWALVDAVGPELRDLDGALEQLFTALGPGARVGAGEVRSAFRRLADERLYVLTDALGERRLAAAMESLRRLLEQGDEPLVIFGAVTGHVRRMLRVRRHAGGGARAVADVSGLPQWRAERLAKQARAYKEEELVSAMSLLAEADLDLKGGDIPPYAVLERVVIEIVAGTRRAALWGG